MYLIHILLKPLSLAIIYHLLPRLYFSVVLFISQALGAAIRDLFPEIS